jgi:hypothetical protein
MVVSSDMPLPELPEVPASTADIAVSSGPVCPPASGVTLWDGASTWASPGCWGMQLSDGRGIEVVGGGRIVVDGLSSAYVAGPGLGIALHQSGTLVLHGSAVDTPGGAILFVGDSGRGKSTMAMTLQARGFPVLCDDLCPIRGRELFPHGNWVRLLGDSLRYFGLDDRVDPVDRKRRVGFDAEFPVSRPVRAVFWLRAGEVDGIRLLAVKGADKLGVLAENTYRKFYLADLGLAAEHFQRLTTLAQDVDVFVLARPATAELSLEWSEVVLSHLRELS